MADENTTDKGTETPTDGRIASLRERIAEQAETIGRLEAERAELRRRVTAAEAARDAATARTVGLERQGWNLASERDAQRLRGDAAAQEREDLRDRADALQARHDALRSAAVSSGPPAAPAGTSEAERRSRITGTADTPGPLRRLWRAIKGQ